MRTPTNKLLLALLIGVATSTAYVVVVAVVAGLIAGPDGLRALLDTLSPLELLVAEGWILFGHVILALRWRLLLRGTDPVDLPVGTAIGVQLSAQICNVALPFLGGDLAASWILERRLGVPYARSLAASIYARLTGLLTCGLLATCSVLALLGDSLGQGLRGGLLRELVAVVLFCAPVLLLSLYPRPLVALGQRLERWGARASSGGSSRRQRLGQGTEMLAWWLHTTATRDRRYLLGAMAWSALNFVTMAIPAMIVAEALGFSTGPLEALAVVTTGSLGNIATVIVPGAGLVEELNIYALARVLLAASHSGAALFALALLVLRIGPLVLGVPAVLYYTAGARQGELGSLWQRDVDPIIATLRAQLTTAGHSNDSLTDDTPGGTTPQRE
jgi:hypothetical protein